MTRVFMLSGLALFGEAVEAVLSREEGVEIVGRDRDIETALAQVKCLCPEVVILDRTLSGRSSIDCRPYSHSAQKYPGHRHEP